MEEFFLDFGNQLMTIVQEFNIQIPDIALDSKSQRIKLILIWPQGQLLANDKSRSTP